MLSIVLTGRRFDYWKCRLVTASNSIQLWPIKSFTKKVSAGWLLLWLLLKCQVHVTRPNPGGGEGASSSIQIRTIFLLAYYRYTIHTQGSKKTLVLGVSVDFTKVSKNWPGKTLLSTRGEVPDFRIGPLVSIFECCYNHGKPAHCVLWDATKEESMIMFSFRGLCDFFLCVCVCLILCFSWVTVEQRWNFRSTTVFCPQSAHTLQHGDLVHKSCAHYVLLQCTTSLGS